MKKLLLIGIVLLLMASGSYCIGQTVYGTFVVSGEYVRGSSSLVTIEGKTSLGTGEVRGSRLLVNGTIETIGIGGIKFPDGTIQTTAGVSTAAHSDNSDYAILSGTASIAGYAGISGVSTIAAYSSVSGVATNAAYSSVSGVATNSAYATLSGTATNAVYAILSGNATNAAIADYALLSSVATTAGTCTGNSATASYSVLSGTSTNCTNSLTNVASLGAATLTGSVSFAAGANATISQSGEDITITLLGAGGSMAPYVTTSGNNSFTGSNSFTADSLTFVPYVAPASVTLNNTRLYEDLYYTHNGNIVTYDAWGMPSTSAKVYCTVDLTSDAGLYPYTMNNYLPAVALPLRPWRDGSDIPDGIVLQAPSGITNEAYNYLLNANFGAYALYPWTDGQMGTYAGARISSNGSYNLAIITFEANRVHKRTSPWIGVCEVNGETLQTFVYVDISTDEVAWTTLCSTGSANADTGNTWYKYGNYDNQTYKYLRVKGSLGNAGGGEYFDPRVYEILIWN